MKTNRTNIFVACSILFLAMSGLCPMLTQAQPSALMETFQVGNTPKFLAFDGANIWVTNFSDNTVTKLRATDGAVLGTFAVGEHPGFIVFDGANIWISNYSDDTITKLRASDGAPLGTFHVDSGPEGLAWDGNNIWVASYSFGTVTKLRGSDGQVLGSFPSGETPLGVTFDGQDIWVANAFPGTVTKLQTSDGAILGRQSVGMSPFCLASKGGRIWVSVVGAVVGLRARDGKVVDTFRVKGYPIGLDIAGAYVCTDDSGSNKATLVNASTGLTSTIAVGSNPVGVLFDGSSIWVANGLDNSVSKITPGGDAPGRKDAGGIGVSH